MIKTSRQLKDKIRNLAKGKSANAQFLMRSYMMERFLERISLSEYKSNFVLKGGVLIASLVGLDFRSTMDIDTTIKGLDVSFAEIERMMRNVVAVPLDDGVLFEIRSLQNIMEEAPYPAIRVSLRALFDGTITPLKIDISSGDIITPGAVQYSYKLMFEDRYIRILSYNLETVLAEKLETIVHRHVANTRMRDFYDIYILKKIYGSEISKQLLHTALEATARRRGSIKQLEMAKVALQEIKNSNDMEKLWLSYRSQYEYARNIDWHDVMEAVWAAYPKNYSENNLP
ncbi:MAG: nucleotidyl transferase AbiEii/AbiGii toxin family protein [Saccharofermentanales bacterium]|jgi:predicted nucleotidyltransferase component of viral defense system